MRQGELPEIIEVIRNPAEALDLVFRLMRSAEKEILVILSSRNEFLRQINVGTGQLLAEIANSRNVSITILIPMDDAAKTAAKDLENQSMNIQVRSIESSSRYTVTVLIVDRTFSLAVELKDDSKSVTEESMGTVTYSTSKSTVLSYVSMFESFMRLADWYEESQSKLNDTTAELEAMKRYVKEVLEEVDKFKKSK